MIPWLALPPDVLAWGLHSGVSVALLGLAALFALRVHRTASVHWIHALVVNVLLASLALPTLAVYLVLQKQFISGLTLGANKG